MHNVRAGSRLAGCDPEAVQQPTVVRVSFAVVISVDV
jgi:hypothetical protein